MSRTTVQRWRARFVASGCDGLQDRPRRGRPGVLPPTTRALVVALACERPAERDVPLSRYSLSELAAEAANVLGAADGPSRSSVWRWLMQDALRPWRHQCWIFPRDSNFLERAAPVLDLYACRWQGQPLWKDEYVLSADEKTSIQARRRLQSTLPPGPYQPARVEHEYARQGAVQYLAAWDVHRAVVFGRCEPKTGKAAFGRLVDQVMAEEPYRSARRVFWIVDNGSSHRGERAVAELRARHPRLVVVHTPVHASWLNQIELYFSIIQRKVLTPNDLYSLTDLIERIRAFGERYSALGKPFAWSFTRENSSADYKIRSSNWMRRRPTTRQLDRPRYFRDPPLREDRRRQCVLMTEGRVPAIAFAEPSHKLPDRLREGPRQVNKVLYIPREAQRCLSPTQPAFGYAAFDKP